MSLSDSQATKKTLRVAIIGYGLAGSVFHAPLVASTPGMAVAAIVTSNHRRQEHAQRDFPMRDAIHRLTISGAIARYDLVVVATPNRTHVPLGIAAMNAGLPVVIDKPLAASVADAEQLLATSRNTVNAHRLPEQALG